MFWLIFFRKFLELNKKRKFINKISFETKFWSAVNIMFEDTIQERLHTLQLQYDKYLSEKEKERIEKEKNEIEKVFNLI